MSVYVRGPTLSAFMEKLAGGGCNSRASKLLVSAEFAFSAASCSLISANNASESWAGPLASCAPPAFVDVDGMAFGTAGDT